MNNYLQREKIILKLRELPNVSARKVCKELACKPARAFLNKLREDGMFILFTDEDWEKAKHNIIVLEKIFMGKYPATHIVSVAIYIVGAKKNLDWGQYNPGSGIYSQKFIATVIGITDVTLRMVYHAAQYFLKEREERKEEKRMEEYNKKYGIKGMRYL